mmetsp:Transcript_3548/g.6722  ORF Transcript_3548/g.6722 Transcript_3548/m.6722 type:complete len:89 (-) Transcript_3548:683-949(-)
MTISSIVISKRPGENQERIVTKDGTPSTNEREVNYRRVTLSVPEIQSADRNAPSISNPRSSIVHIEKADHETEIWSSPPVGFPLLGPS